MAKKMSKRTVKKSPTKDAKKPSIQLLGDRVLIRPGSVEEKTASGFILPDTAKKEKTKQHGVVVAVGPGVRSDDGHVTPMTVQKGDHVLFNAGWDNEVQVEDTEHYLVREGDVLWIIR